MQHQKRTQLFVDRPTQSVLLMRAVLYWAACIIMLTLVMVCWRFFAGPSRPLYIHLDYLWFHYKPALFASIFLLPIFVIDMLRVSNRFAGPMVRLRNAMRRLADGDQDVAAIHFRNNDFWADFAGDFNRLIERLNQETRTDTEPVIVPGIRPADTIDLQRTAEMSERPATDAAGETEPCEEELVAVANE